MASLRRSAVFKKCLGHSSTDASGPAALLLLEEVLDEQLESVIHSSSDEIISIRGTHLTNPSLKATYVVLPDRLETIIQEVQKLGISPKGFVIDRGNPLEVRLTAVAT